MQTNIEMIDFTSSMVIRLPKHTFHSRAEKHDQHYIWLAFSTAESGIENITVFVFLNKGNLGLL